MTIFEVDDRLIDHLLSLSSGTLGEENAEAAYKRTVARFRRLLGAKACLLYVLEPERKKLRVRRADGLSRPESALPELSLSESRIGHAVRNKQPMLVKDLTTNLEISSSAREVAAAEGHQHAAILPIDFHGGQGAVSVFFSELPPNFSLELVQRLAESLAMSLRARSRRVSPDRLEWILQHTAHSLRSPLDGVAGIADELREAIDAGTERSASRVTGITLKGEPARTVRRLLRDIEQEAERGSKRISTILSSRPGALSLAQPDMRPVRISDVVHRCADRQRREARRKKMSIIVRDSISRLPSITGDEELLDIAFDNIIENARKYGDSGTSIEITGEHRSRQIRIRVTDRGLGIPPELRSSLFQAYRRPVQSVFRKIKGTGLGLEVTASIIIGHGGSIEGRSTPDAQASSSRKLFNEGFFTTFEVTLPV